MPGVSLNVVSVYSDKQTAEMAAEMCRALRHKLGGTFHMHQSTWNAELLKSPKLRALAAREASASDLVIMAAPEGAELSPEISDWFDLWRKRTREVPSALVALLPRETPGAPRVVKEKLRSFAASAKMDFFCHSAFNPRRAETEEAELFA